MSTSFDFPVEIVRTPRKKTASIEVNGGIAKVTVPEHLSDQRLNSLIKKRSVWIKQKIAILSASPLRKPKEYVSGEVFQYLGRNYRLKRLLGPIEGVRMKSGQLQVTVAQGSTNALTEASVRSSLNTWYETHALAKLTEKTHKYAAILGVDVGNITVKDYKARWGSCFPSGDIAYNWRIIMAPHHIIDYVVVHELCHLREQNHSPKYWRHVESVIGDYKYRREWLKVYGASLVI